MADEAFALSPISARSASPTDADYDAIREAFMETARGRWFLGEYARRNRNADTAMVLEAVERLEQSLAASRTELAAAAPSPGIATAIPAHAEILASVKMILARTRSALEAALSVPDMEEALSPLRRTARIVQEIAWGLRESGSDGRICDILDKQVRALTDAGDTLAAAEHRDAVLHAFDASLVQIEKLAESNIVSDPGEVLAADDPSPDMPVSEEKPADPVAPEAPAAMIAEINVTAAQPVPPRMLDMANAGAIAMPVNPARDIEPAKNVSNASASLGASLMAHGIVAQAASSRPDPLAPIRRMSQAEKIAFFS